MPEVGDLLVTCLCNPTQPRRCAVGCNDWCPFGSYTNRHCFPHSFTIGPVQEVRIVTFPSTPAMRNALDGRPMNYFERGLGLAVAVPNQCGGTFFVNITNNQYRHHARSFCYVPQHSLAAQKAETEMKPAGTAAAAAASLADAKAQREVQPVPLPGGLPEHCARANPEDKSTPLIPGYYTEKRKWGATLDHGPGCAENDTQAASLQHLPRRKVMKAWKRQKQPLEHPKLGRTRPSCFLSKRPRRPW